MLERNANSKQWTSHGANQKKKIYYSPKDAIFCVNNFQHHRVRRTFSRVLEDVLIKDLVVVQRGGARKFHKLSV